MKSKRPTRCPRLRQSASTSRFGFAGLLVLASLSLVATVGLGAQEEGSRDDDASTSSSDDLQASFGDIINVKVINVPVYVRDKKGNAITGLTVDDFELLEDGKPVPITNFYEVVGGDRADLSEADAQTQLERIKSHPELDPRISRKPANERLTVIVYVDHFNIRPHNRNRVFRYLREFLREKVGRDDQVMLASYNRSLKIERTLTGDSAVISRALFELEKHTGGRTQMDSERRDLLRDIQEARDEGILEARVRLFAESQYNDLQFTLDGLKEMVDMLGGIPGRKALIYVSDGLPMRAGEDLFVAAAERYPDTLSDLRLESMQYDAGRRYRVLASQAASNQIAFYTIDANGLLGRTDRGAETGSYHSSTQVESIFQSNMQQPLRFLSDYTGGQAIVNTNNFEGGFERFGVDFSNYYSLGFTPGHAGSGREYNLEVKVKTKGYEVRHRESYRDKPIEREMTEATLAALQFGALENDMGIELVRRDSIRRQDGHYMVHVDVRIPIGELVLLPRDGFHQGRVRLWVQAGDSQGRLSDPQVEEILVQVPDEDLEQAREQAWVYEARLAMREGDQKLAIAVRDDVGSRSSFVTRTFRVGG